MGCYWFLSTIVVEAVRLTLSLVMEQVALVSLPSQVKVMSGSHSEVQHTRTTVV